MIERQPAVRKPVDVVASRKLVVFLAAALCAAGPVQAQTDGPSPPSAAAKDGVGEIPPELQLPEELPKPLDVDDAIADGDAGDVSFGCIDPAAADWPARLESSGTWFRRGFWYVEQDVVVMNRDYSRPTLLASDATGGRLTVLAGTQIPVFPSSRELRVEAAKPDAAVAARFTLGRFLLRDDKNRDHFIDFTYLGLGHWSVSRAVESVEPDRLFTPLGARADGVTHVIETLGFNYANTQRYSLKTKFDNYEWNYRLRYRHRKDQMELGPDGRWTRKMTPSGFHSFLFGLRFVDMRERFGWQSQAVDAFVPVLFEGQIFTVDAEGNRAIADDNRSLLLRESRDAGNGDMSIRTRNDLVGLQFGGDMIRQWPRWSVGIRGKAGPFVNFARQQTHLVINDPFDPGSRVELLGVDPDTGTATFFEGVAQLPDGFVNRAVEAHEETFSLVGEVGVFAHYHIQTNMTLRLAFEGMWLSSVANAAEQVDFDTMSIAKVAAGGSQSYLGLSFGLDYYW